MKNFVTLSSFIVSFVLLLGTNDPKYSYLFLLPLFYGILYGVNSFLKDNYNKYISLSILLITSYLRYVVTPLFMFLGDFESSASVYSDALFHKAISLQAYEEVVFLLVLLFAAPKIYYKVPQITRLKVQQKEKSNSFVLIVVAIAVALILIYPELISRYHFVPSLSGAETDDIADSSLSGSFSLIVRAAKLLIVLLALIVMYRRYEKTRNSKWIYLSIVIIGIDSLFVNDLSRFGIIVPAATFVYLIAQLYPNKKKSIVFWSLFLIGLVVVYTTIIKMFSDARGGGDDGQDYSYWGAVLQMYFQGISDTVIGLAASEKMILSPLVSFINDAISNVAILSHYSVESLRSLYIYNVEYSGGVSFDKILPNVCAGYNYFGFIGAPLIVSVISILGMRMDVKSVSAYNVYDKFLYIYGAITCSVPHMVFYTMTISNMVNTFFVLYIILYINKIVIRK